MINIGKYPNLEEATETTKKRYEELCGSEVIKKIIKGKSAEKRTERELLERSRMILKEDYTQYEKKRMRLQEIKQDTRLTEETADLLRNTYKAKPVPIKKALDRIDNLLPTQLYGRCPYCRLSEPSTYDHYLPQSDYPEYALFPLNLIPSCSLCNGKKGDVFLGEDRNRVILNLRFDKLPNYPFYKCVLGIKGRIAYVREFRLELKSGDQSNAIIYSHFDRLDLNNRVKKYAEGVLNDLFEINCGKHRKATLRYNLEQALEGIEKNRGMNYWKACVYRAVLDDESVLDLLAKR